MKNFINFKCGGKFEFENMGLSYAYLTPLLKTYPNLLTVEKVSSGRNLKFRGTNGFSLFPPPHKK